MGIEGPTNFEPAPQDERVREKPDPGAIDKLSRKLISVVGAPTVEAEILATDKPWPRDYSHDYALRNNGMMHIVLRRRLEGDVITQEVNVVRMSKIVRVSTGSIISDYYCLRDGVIKKYTLAIDLPADTGQPDDVYTREVNAAIDKSLTSIDIADAITVPDLSAPEFKEFQKLLAEVVTMFGEEEVSELTKKALIDIIEKRTQGKERSVAEGRATGYLVHLSNKDQIVTLFLDPVKGQPGSMRRSMLVQKKDRFFRLPRLLGGSAEPQSKPSLTVAENDHDEFQCFVDVRAKNPQSLQDMIGGKSGSFMLDEEFAKKLIKLVSEAKELKK